MWLFVFYLSHGLVLVYVIELSHMGKYNENLDLVCENSFSHLPSKFIFGDALYGTFFFSSFSTSLNECRDWCKNTV